MTPRSSLGCFALKCGRCNCGFCAWCLKDCGQDAHEHVANCKHKFGGHGRYFGQDEEFREAHKRRGERKARDYLNKITSKEIRGKVMAKCRKDFTDLNMRDLARECDITEAGARGAAEENDENGEMELGFDEQMALAVMAAEIDQENPFGLD